MANIEVGLLETEAQLSSIIESSGKTVPKPGERANIIEHLDYMIELLGTMVSDETFKAAKKKMANGYNAINDRIEIINWMLASGEISGDVDLEPLTVNENGEYMPGAGKGYSRVVVETPEVEDQSVKLLARNFTTFEHITAEIIGDNAFCKCYSLTSVSFPACTRIDAYAFDNCSSLTSVNFPVCNYIGRSVFQSCSSLTTVNFPACSYIMYGAFRYCYSLTSVSFPACTKIDTYAFDNCSSLTSVNFPVCSYIGDNTFYSCSSLTTVNLPACSNIGNGAFQNCVNLISLYLLYSGICNLFSVNPFINTPISNYSTVAGRYGSIFVPASLVDQYKSNRYWSYYSDRITAYTE